MNQKESTFLNLSKLSVLDGLVIPSALVLTLMLQLELQVMIMIF